MKNFILSLMILVGSQTTFANTVNPVADSETASLTGEHRNVDSSKIHCKILELKNLEESQNANGNKDYVGRKAL